MAAAYWGNNGGGLLANTAGGQPSFAFGMPEGQILGSGYGVTGSVTPEQRAQLLATSPLTYGMGGGGQGVGASAQTQFPRFNFGAGSSGWNPYMPQSYANPQQQQTSAAAGGVNTSGTGPGGTQVDNLFGQGGIGNGPQDTNPAWNQSAPGQGSLPWQTYKFDNPTNSVQTNFNALMQQNPTLAYKYLTSAGGGNEIKGLFGQYGQAPSTANYVANAFMQPTMVGDSGGPGGGTAYDYLGLKPGDIPGVGEVSGNTFSAGGLTGNLAQQGAYEQKMSDPRAFLKANPFQSAPSIGSAEWWNAAKGG